MFPEKLEQLLEALNGTKQLLIIAHNNPDPDAIASVAALRYLLQEIGGVESTIGYRGIIGRAENKALSHFLGHPMQYLSAKQLETAERVALVDTQPGAGNQPLPADRAVSIVLDHHPLRDTTTAVATFSDVRPHVGATASILSEYFKLADIPMPSPLATALFYGIKTDTLGLARGTHSVDMTAICYLLPLIDLAALLKIERARVPPEYFKSFAATLQTARIYKNIVVAHIGVMEYPDLTAEMADFLLRMQGSEWIICTGLYQGKLFISVRTHKQRGAGQLVQMAVGNRGIAGGHGAMAGGQILLRDDEPEDLMRQLTQKMLAELGVAGGDVGRSLA